MKRPVWMAALGLVFASVLAWWLPRQMSKPVAPDATSSPQQQAVAERAASGAAAKSQGGTAPGGAGPAGGGPVVVEVAPVRAQRVVDEVQAVGTVRSRQSVMLRPEVGGRIAAFGFKDGQHVRRGQWLVQLDDTLPRAQLQQAQAQMSIARSSHVRNQELLAQGFVSRSAVDQSAASLQVAQAQVATSRAQLARLRVMAPFDGTVGIRKVSTGDYVKDGADLVSLEDTQHLVVDFRVPERHAAQLTAGLALELNVDALPGRAVRAHVVAVEPLVDADGRALAVRAEVPQAPPALKPGMFARVRVLLQSREAALVVPEEAVIAQGRDNHVWRLMPAVAGASAPASVQRTAVSTGSRGPGWVEVTQGLVAADTVVTAGQARLKGDQPSVKVVELERVPAGRASGSAAPASAATPAASESAPRAASAPQG